MYGYKLIPDWSPLSLKTLNDQLRMLWDKILGNIDNKDIRYIEADKIKVGELTADVLFAQIAQIDTLIANQAYIQQLVTQFITTQYIKADYAKIHKLTVSHLMTIDDTSNLEELNFIDIQGKHAKWITAKRKYYPNGTPYPDIQLTDDNGQLLYWVDANKTAITTTPTDYPVMVHQYDYHVKFDIFFDDSKNNVPVIQLGEGTGTGLNEKAFIYKKDGGLVLEYYKAPNETRYYIEIGDNGIITYPPIDPASAIGAIERLEQDVNGRFTKVIFYRKDGTKFMESVLEGTSPNYIYRWEYYYDTTGTNIIETRKYQRYYDNLNNLVKEVRIL